MATELELISKQLDRLTEKFDEMQDQLNKMNATIIEYKAHYGECKTTCHIQKKVLFGNGDGEKGLEFKVIELMKWKTLQHKIFWLLIIPILTANAGIFTKSLFFPDKPQQTIQATVQNNTATKGP